MWTVSSSCCRSSCCVVEGLAFPPRGLCCESSICNDRLNGGLCGGSDIGDVGSLDADISENGDATATSSFNLDVRGTANVGALTATSAVPHASDGGALEKIWE